MGPARFTHASQAAYLTNLSVKFQSFMNKAIDGKFAVDSTFDDSPSLRLATAVATRMEGFTEEMAAYGHSYIFQKTEAELTDGEATLDSDQTSGTEGVSDESQVGSFAITRKTVDVAEIAEALRAGEKVSHRHEDILSWLTEIYKKCRGFELGTFEPAILASVMRQQSSNWVEISLGFVSDVIVLVHECIRTALEHVTPAKVLRSRIFDNILAELIKRYLPAIQRAQFLVAVENETILLTLNHYFNDNLQKL